MRKSVILAVLILPVLPLAAWAILVTWFTTPERQIMSDDLDRSVVRIFVSGPQGIESGSGLVINHAGHIVTNYHVVRRHIDNGWHITVAEQSSDEDPSRTAELVEVFPGEDLAILYVDGLGRPPVIFADTAQKPLVMGDDIYSIGFPGAGRPSRPLG